MYAVIRTGGKQYRVGPGDIIEVERLPGQVGDTVILDDVLLVSSGDQVVVGQPTVDGARVEARITGQYRGEKILVFRYRPKKRIRVRRGHRQYLTRLQIQAIQAEGFETATQAQEPAPVAEVSEETSAAAETVEEEAPTAEAAAEVQAEQAETTPAEVEAPAEETGAEEGSAEEGEA